MRLQVLFHIVGSGELLLAARIRTLDCLFGGVNLGVPRGVAGCGKRLFAAMRVSVAARVSLGGTVRGTRCSGGGRIVIIRCCSTAVNVGGALGRKLGAVENSSWVGVID